MTENDMTSLLIKLANLGVTGIKVKYDGSGDSGYIEWIGYTKDLCETPEDVNDNIDDWASDYNLEQLDSSSCSLIKDFAQEKILDDIEDWWNNEGGFGELCICIPSGKYIINNSIRIINYEEHFHDGDLISKTL